MLAPNHSCSFVSNSFLYCRPKQLVRLLRTFTHSYSSSSVIARKNRSVAAASLADLLLRPFAAHIQSNERVVIVAAGMFSNVPLHMLPWANAGDSVAKPLMMLRTVSYLPSLALLSRLLDRAKYSPPVSSSASADSRSAATIADVKDVKDIEDDVLVIGNPKDMRKPFLADPPNGALPSLRWAESEANLIASIYRVQPLIGQSASRASFEKALKTCRVLHYAGYLCLLPLFLFHPTL
jgi:CHAT domain-containing protein